MKKIYFILTAVAIILSNAVKAQTYVIAAWNYSSISAQGTMATPLNATTKDNNLGVAEISRGPGLSPATINYGFASGVTGLIDNTETDAINSGDYHLINLKAANGTLTVSKIGFRIYRHANGPQRFRWAYSKDGTTFTNIGVEVDMTGVSNSDSYREIDLSSDVNLVNIPNTTTVTFRLVGYDGNGATNKNFGLRSNNSNAVTFEGSLSTTLPVQLSSFTAKPQANTIQLNWQTVSEQNNSHFEVLRSTDGNNFNVIGRKEGNGTTDQTNTYSFLDIKPVSGTSYYALKQYDLNGDNKLYDAIPVKFSLSNGTFGAVVISSGIKIIINSEVEESANISIYDISGKQLASKQISLNKGVNEAEVTNFDLVKGKLYLVKLKSATQNQTIKVLN